MIKITIRKSANTQQERTYLNKDSKEYKRRSHGYGIAPIFAMAFIAAVTIGTTLVSTGKNFADFQLKANQVTNYDTASLATATEVARMSNDFLKDFRTSLRKSIASSRIDDLNSCSDAPASPTEENPPANPPQNPQPNGGQPNSGRPPLIDPNLGDNFGNHCQNMSGKNYQTGQEAICGFSNDSNYQSFLDCFNARSGWANNFAPYQACQQATGYNGPIPDSLMELCSRNGNSNQCQNMFNENNPVNSNMARRTRTNDDFFRNDNFRNKKKKGKGKKGKGNKGKKGKKGKGGKKGNGGNNGPTFVPKRDPLTTGETLPDEEPECVPNPQPIYDNPQNIVERKGYFRDYANEIKEYKAPSSEVVKTLDYGLEQGREQVHSDRDFKLMGSIALAPQIEKTDPKYASMLIGKNNFDFKSRTFSEDEITDYHRNYTTNDGLIKLSPEVINALVDKNDPKTIEFFKGNEEKYGIKKDPYGGITFKDLVSGLDLDIEVVVKKPTETTPTKYTTTTRKSVAQLRFATGTVEGVCNDGSPIPPDGVCPETDHCPVTNRVVQAAGACLNDLAAEGCPCFCDVHVTAPACENFNGNNGNPNGDGGIDPGDFTFGFESINPGEFKVFVKDPNAPISPSNPIIVWRENGAYQGNYSAYYPDGNGGFIYEHGTGLTATEISNGGFTEVDPSQFTPIINVGPSSTGQSTHVDIGIKPNSQQRYSKVELEGGGQWVGDTFIPDGAVAVLNINNDVNITQNPNPNGIGNYHDITIYDADGNLIGTFTPQELRQAGIADEIMTGVQTAAQNGGNDSIVPGGNAYGQHDLNDLFNSPEAIAKFANNQEQRGTGNINSGDGSWGGGIRGKHGESDTNPLPGGEGFEQSDRTLQTLNNDISDLETKFLAQIKAIEDAISDKNTSLEEKEYLRLQLKIVRGGKLSFAELAKLETLEGILMIDNETNALKLASQLILKLGEYKDALKAKEIYLKQGRVPCWYDQTSGCINVPKE